MVAAARNEIHQVDPAQPISNIRTMDEVLGEETASRRLGYDVADDLRSSRPAAGNPGDLRGAGLLRRAAHAGDRRAGSPGRATPRHTRTRVKERNDVDAAGCRDRAGRGIRINAVDGELAVRGKHN